jgi:membrane protein YqaA with SNARE-associated domain
VNERPSKAEPAEDKALFDLGRLHPLLEIVAVAALVGILFWLTKNIRPLGIFGWAILNYRLWILVLAVSAVGTAGGLVPYYVGQRGTEAVLKHYPSLKGQRWDRLEAAFRRWGAPTLIVSGIPALGVALLVAAGAMGIRRRAFLFWVFGGKILRNWVLAFAFLLGLQIVR